MKTLLASFLFMAISFTAFSQAQDSLLTSSNRFKSDSLGYNKIRGRYVHRNKGDTVLIFGKYIEGYTKEWVIKYLGKPEGISSTPDLKCNYEYLIEHQESVTEELLIQFDEAGKVLSLNIVFII